MAPATIILRPCGGVGNLLTHGEGFCSLVIEWEKPDPLKVFVRPLFNSAVYDFSRI
jgi:hypothetical protein